MSRAGLSPATSGAPRLRGQKTLPPCQEIPGPRWCFLLLSPAAATVRQRQDLCVGAPPPGLQPLPVPWEDSRQVCQGSRTVQSEETEIPSLAEERKLKTKCFFLKAGRKQPPWNFLMGVGVG